jgi:glycosyltransferase involved in cell wall biosynthesis
MVLADRSGSIGRVGTDGQAAPVDADRHPPSFDEVMRCIRENLDARTRFDDHAPVAPYGVSDGVSQRALSDGTVNALSTGQPRIALVTASSPRVGGGGAERLYVGLVSALRLRGAAVVQVEVTSDESSFDAVLRSYLRAYDLDVSAFDGVISTKAPSFAVRHRNHVCFLLHTMRSYYDMFENVFASATPDLVAQRSAIHQIDTAALRRAPLGDLFVVGSEVRERLQEFNGVDGEVLHHPTSLQSLRTGQFRHLLLPGRLHRWKRVDLALQAARLMRHDVELIICGAGEDEERLRGHASGMSHVRFVGHVTDDELADLYADALAVVYCPIREDYGLVPIEAFSSGKPVVTCTDSGEPTRLVADGVNGLVCNPDPWSMAKRLDWLVEHPLEAMEMGQRGRAVITDIGWEEVCDKLLGALDVSGS